VRSHKKLIVLFALMAAVLLGPAVSTEAQPRGYGHGGGHVVVVRGGYDAPYYSPFFYADPWYGAQYPYPYPPYPYGGYHLAEPDSSVRLDVKPKQAEVYVDGYDAGIVDDFDGSFQRLRVEPGEHEIELWLGGYHTVRQKVYLTPNNTFKVKYQMEALASGQPPEAKPQPIDPPQVPQGGYDPRLQQPQDPRAQQPQPRQPMGPPPTTRRAPPPEPRDPEAPRRPEAPRPGPGNGAYGTIAIRVQPVDADVSIDGENWRTSGGQDRLTVEVAEGSHTVEIRKAGYRTYVTQVDVRHGLITPINVSLRGEQP
jgi:hypothetical protein